MVLAFSGAANDALCEDVAFEIVLQCLNPSPNLPTLTVNVIQLLQVPGPVLKAGANDVLLLEVESASEKLEGERCHLLLLKASCLTLFT